MLLPSLQVTVTALKMQGLYVGRSVSLEPLVMQLNLNQYLEDSVEVTSLRMSWPGDKWRCVLEGDMKQSVMTIGAMMMPLSPVLNWEL